MKKWFVPRKFLSNQRPGFDLDKIGEIFAKYLTVVPGIRWSQTENLGRPNSGRGAPRTIQRWTDTTLCLNKTWTRDFLRLLIYFVKITAIVVSDPKLVQNRFLPRPLRLLRMLVPVYPNLLSRNLLLPIRQQLTSLLLCVFYVFSMGGLARALMGLFWTGLILNRTHSRYLFDPRLQATVANRLTMTQN